MSAMKSEIILKSFRRTPKRTRKNGQADNIEQTDNR